MKTTIPLVTPYNGKMEITPAEAVRMQHDGHSSYHYSEYVHDLMTHFGATEEEAKKVIDEELHLQSNEPNAARLVEALRRISISAK